MRRARIKAVATVPVRRKAAQANAVTENTEQDVPKNESVNPAVNDKETKTPQAPEFNSKPAEPVSPSKSPQKNKIQSVEDVPIKTETKTDNPQRTSNSSTEVPASSTPPTSQLVSTAPLAPTVPCVPTSPSVPTSVPGSPIKMMQGRSCFMRPTPRLDGGGRIRRNSVQGSGASASESEDDSRRSTSIAPSRIRNDSICSVQSLKDSGNVSNIAKLNLGQKRRMVVSESARKLAEAKREFLLKHENKPPDKSKLTMYDLIYYNPVTNPMKPKPVTRPAARKISVSSVLEKTKNEEEETVDEPTEMLVPQVKVGPNGQIIVDEQSLVIDQYKAQENIDRSDIFVDEDTTGNGFYKRRKKSKDWNKWETVKFYKALNTYGTDFLLMQSIFPNRTRQELKLKYKKEERLNQNLVEKALQYQEFDTEALEKDLANVEESERREKESSKKPAKKDANSSKKRKRRKRCQIVTNEINCENDELDTNKSSGDELSSEENARITITKKIKKRTTRKRILVKTDDSSADENAKINSDSDPEVYKKQITRSGRLPKKAKKLKSESPIKIYDVQSKEQPDESQNNNDKENDNEIVLNDTQNIQMESHNEFDVTHNNSNEIENVEISEQIMITPSSKENEVVNQDELFEVLKANSSASSNVFEGISDDIPNMANLKPGSLVVLKKESVDFPGKTYMQVYIVGEDYDANNPNSKDGLLPIDLSPDVLETVTNCIKNIQPEHVS